MRSSRAASSGRSSAACSGSSAMAGDAELRLRDRLGKLRGLSLLGGTRLSGELERLQRQLERLEAEPTDEEIWRSVELARHPDRPYTLDYVEQHGQGGTLARSHELMAELAVPVVSCIIGEGGSGGASALALADRVLMQENAIYTVITPEGCAAILWRDAAEARKAAAAFKPDAVHSMELGVIDGIVLEPAGGAHEDHDEAARMLGESLSEALDDIRHVPGDELRRLRRRKFREL